VGWFYRRAITSGTVTLYVKEYLDEQKVYHIDIDQTGIAGLKGTTELRILDWQEHEHTDYIFGTVRGKCRWIRAADVDDEFLKKGWGKEMDDNDAMHNHIESVDKGWVVDQLWGFEDVQGERRYVRHLVVVKGDKRIERRLVYDWQK